MPKFKYFHGDEAEQFSFFRIPHALIKDEQFHGLSTEAKLLYGLMLDRMGLSLRSGWLDDDNRVFIFYTLKEVQETLRCGHNKATRLFRDCSTTPENSGSSQKGLVIAPQQPSKKQAKKRPEPLSQIHQDQCHPDGAESRHLQMCGNAA